jgi:hypothetical protein
MAKYRTPHRPSTSRRLAAVLAVAVISSLAACDGGSSTGTAADDKPEVATIVSSGASPSASAASERPLIRTDTSVEESERLYKLYYDCLGQNGVEIDRGRPNQRSPKYEQARKACESKEPETIWQRAKRTDPEYNDKLRDWVTCIRAFGIDAWEENGSLAFNSLPSDEGMRHVDECQNKVFGTG